MGLSKLLGLKRPKTPVRPAAAPDPLPLVESGDVAQADKRKRPRRGRAATIIAGDLEPDIVGLKTLLG